jgi:hypothetical protein
MKEQDAVRVFEGLGRAYKQIKHGDELRALHALLASNVLPSELGATCSSALTTLRSVCEQLADWKSRNAAIAAWERQLQIVQLRDSGLTYSAIANLLGNISGARVRQIYMTQIRRARFT